MTAAPVSEQELRLAKLRVAGGMVMGMQTIWQQAQRRIDGILNGYPPDYFDYPPDATIEHGCREFHRAFTDHAQQPETRTKSNEAVTVRVHGRIGKDGKPNSLKVLDTIRPDLAEEALRLVSGWTFHPAMCEYQPATQETNFEVRFKGW